jgi:DNA modification methylase
MHPRYFEKWFGGHRQWCLGRRFVRGRGGAFALWIVQTREQQPIRLPDRDGLIVCRDLSALYPLHPCPKPVEEMIFLVESLTEPGDIVLDPFCGLGATLIAAHLLGRRWIGCDLSPNYCRIALRRLAKAKGAIA